MQCAKLNLLDRSKKLRYVEEKPRRYCQKRLVNPDHEDSARWLDVLDRYCEKAEEDVRDGLNETNASFQTDRASPDLCLSVQNIQFQGDIQQRKRPRTSFKYKNCQQGQKHRMFVKEIVDDVDLFDDERMSEITNYGDYTKYFQNMSRPSSRESIACDQQKDSKSVPVDIVKQNKKPKKEVKVKKAVKLTVNNDVECTEDNDTKVSFQKYGSRKSLTITRAETPETLQIIRVDVVCNYSNPSTMSDNEEKKQPTPRDSVSARGKGTKNMIYDKYLLTNTVKTLDENISGGKVTLLCKTFRLTDRCRRYDTKTKTTGEPTSRVQK